MGQDMLKLERLLRRQVAPHLQKKAEARILDLACGRCDEAETLMGVVKQEMAAEKVKLIGADIRIREIRQARERLAGKDAEFLIEDATQLQQHRQLGEDFDMVFLRHQNYWHGSEVWKKIFDQGLAKLSEDGLLVIDDQDLRHRRHPHASCSGRRLMRHVFYLAQRGRTVDVTLSLWLMSCDRLQRVAGSARCDTDGDSSRGPRGGPGARSQPQEERPGPAGGLCSEPRATCAGRSPDAYIRCTASGPVDGGQPGRRVVWSSPWAWVPIGARRSDEALSWQSRSDTWLRRTTASSSRGWPLTCQPSWQRP